MPTPSAALIYPSKAGLGGLGFAASASAAALGLDVPVTALGPGRIPAWPLETPDPAGVTWDAAPVLDQSWLARRLLRRWRGRAVLAHDRHLGRWAAGQLDRVAPVLIYAFAQVGLESLEWAISRGVPTVLECPNGHIAGFARIYRDEWKTWVGGTYRGHPSDAMVGRVEREYELADRIRVYSEWAKESLVSHGVPAAKVFVCPPPLNRLRFVPPPTLPAATGPLRLVYAGTLDLRKGFVYLLQAARKIGAEKVRIEFAGSTGDRGSKALLARERRGLDVAVTPDRPEVAYNRAELFVLPSLEDGFGLVTGEAMACGLPAIVTDQCGSAEWVSPGETGWVVPAGAADALAEAIEHALRHRADLPEIGQAARRSVLARCPSAALRSLADLTYGRNPCP